MRTALRTLKPTRRLATTGLTALGAAGIATTALAGTAHAAGAPAKAEGKSFAVESAASTAAPHNSAPGKAEGKTFAVKSASATVHFGTAADRAEGASAEGASPAVQGASSTAQDIAAQAKKAAAQAAHAKAEQAHAKADSKQAGGEEYADNLDGWIREARAIMKKHGIPGSYDGIKRNIIRESAGDPNAVNDWDINAQKGTPSKGLLQVIQPTFDRYHVEGTPDKLTDPVANIVAACNYAADRYGSMDNVNSAY
ncbi:transglycosylase SLT domain-containing protein [Streptomyces sp. 891-h]|uniref:transglycosylase SLT domain-containing protein n=1 Tax=Streptomyces sp. 891-h TaxID=2720714 RepID=UPI001FA95F32|nr:transglycosylase SLT domain-containing protein [Streptomyces sp. 891-h]UNZ17342.1 transglycosylase SLT domain-containing protein [Streptomyces sp. 891-h]